MKPYWPLSPRLLAGLAIVAVVAIAISGLLIFGAFDKHSSVPVAHTAPRVQRVKITPPKPVPPKPAAPSVFALEEQMSFSQRMKRWEPYTAEAAKRFNVPQNWIRAVMQIESGGRTMLAEGKPITSSMGAMGLMQLMPSTYEDMRVQYGLGRDPYDPHDNILAGAAYLRWLRGKYGYPTMFAAYNDGPGNLEERMLRGGLLPAETRDYLTSIAGSLAGRRGRGLLVKFTRPNGLPVMIDAAATVSVRAALPDEYAPSVRTVITVGKVKQGVRESLASARSIIRAHGGGV